MRSIVLSAIFCVVSSMLVGCGGVEEKKIPELKPEEKAKLDQAHAAQKASQPAAAPAAK